MLDLLLFVWSWLYIATAIEAQAVQMMARSTAPKKKCRCNYIMKESYSVCIGESDGKEKESG